MIAIKTDKLRKRFPRASGYLSLLPFRQRQWTEAVRGVSLEIREGEFFGLLGPNGAGKTTLIKMLCCLVLPDTGTGEVFGHDIIKDEQAVKETIGLVSAEERSFYWRITGRENLRFYASLYNISGKKAKARIEELLDMVGLAEHGDVRFQNYSTGMRQKLAIARGLLSQPRVLFVDEPTRSLDPVSAQAVRQFLKEKVAGEGKTVILATHNLTEAEQLCDRLAIMDRGQLKASGTVKDLRSLFQTQEKCQLRLKNFTEAILAPLAGIAGVLDCRVTEQYDGIADIELMISSRAAVLPGVLQTLVNSSLEVMDCRLEELPLEEIFIHALDGGVTREAN